MLNLLIITCKKEHSKFQKLHSTTLHHSLHKLNHDSTAPKQFFRHAISQVPGHNGHEQDSRASSDTWHTTMGMKKPRVFTSLPSNTTNQVGSEILKTGRLEMINYIYIISIHIYADGSLF